MITRRRLLLMAGAGALAAPEWAYAQQVGRRYRIGWFTISGYFKEPYSLAFVQRLAELGFVEGRNLSIERRDPANRLERIPALSAELGNLN